MVKVALVKGERALSTVKRAIALAGGVNEFVDKPILIKVNFITTKTYETGATTDPIVVEALIQSIQPINKQVFVVESDATMTDASKACEMTGMQSLCDRYSVQFINLRYTKDKFKVNVPVPETLSEITLPRMVLESYVISAAKLKTHDETQVTLGLKNMFGLLPDKFKAKFHARGIEKVIVDINSVIKPAFTIIDGFFGMEGSGPVSGKPVKMDLIIAGKDPVATDAVASKVMGFEPTSIFHIKRAAEKGIGTLEDIQVVGNSIESVRHIFERA